MKPLGCCPSLDGSLIPVPSQYKGSRLRRLVPVAPRGWGRPSYLAPLPVPEGRTRGREGTAAGGSQRNAPTRIGKAALEGPRGLGTAVF